MRVECVARFRVECVARLLQGTMAEGADKGWPGPEGETDTLRLVGVGWRAAVALQGAMAEGGPARPGPALSVFPLPVESG